MTQANKGWKESLSKWRPLEKLESMSSSLLPSSTSISTCNTSSCCTCSSTTSVGYCFPNSRSSNKIDPTTDHNVGRKDLKKRMGEEEERGRQIVYSLSINT